MRMPMMIGLALATALAGCERADGDPAAAPSNQASGAQSSQAPATPKGRFEPRNECIELPGVETFYSALETAIENRDADALLAITDANVKLDFGGGSGLRTFRERLAEEDGRLWESLEQLMALGCARAANGDLVLPWSFEQDMADLDPATALIVTGADVPMRSAAAIEAPTVETISWDAVSLTGGLDPEAPFQKVRTAGGKEGFIASDKLRSPLDYRLRVDAFGDSWRIVSFVAGD